MNQETMAKIMPIVFDGLKIIVPPILTFFLGVYVHKKYRKEALEDKRQEKANESLLKENEQLKVENGELRNRLELFEGVEQSTTGNYLILKKTGQAICPICWEKDHKNISIYDNGWGRYVCGGCGKSNVFDHAKDKAHKAKTEENNRSISDFFDFKG